MIKELAQHFFRWFCHPDYYPEIVGDLEEMYQRNLEKGGNLAQWKYLFQVLGLFRPSLMRSFTKYPSTNPAMFKSYFKISTRILWKQKFYSSINILGLAVGMGVCLLIYQYIQFELSYDRFHENAENIYRLTLTTIKNGGTLGTGVGTSFALGVRGKENIPGIEDFVRIHPQEEGFGIANPENNERFQEDRVLFVDSNFLRIFNFPLKIGDQESVLDEKYNMVVTEQMARKYFGNANPIGKVLTGTGGYGKGEYTITAVLKELPVNSHLQFDFLLPMELLLEAGQYKNTNGWGWTNFVTYVITNENANLGELQDSFDQLADTYRGAERAKLYGKWKIGLQSLPDIHLKSNFPEKVTTNNGDIRNVRFFSIIAVFILFMAWVNYVNLSTARAIQRAKEVGVRKTIGALKNQLVSQFMTESFLINCIAALLAIGIALLMLPVLNNIIGKELPFNILQNQKFWFWFATTIIAGALLSGLYPAFVLSSFKPVSVLKSVRVMAKGGLSLRKGLIIFQFLTSVLLISCTYLVYQQITFMKNQDLGIDMEKILVLNGPRFLEYKNLETTYQTFKNKVTNYHSISSGSATSSVPSKGYIFSGEMRKLGEPKEDMQVGNLILADSDFTKTYDLKFLAGGPFTEEMAIQGIEEKVILNEEAVKTFGFVSPNDAIYEKLIILNDDTVEVVGVVKNFHWNSLRVTNSPIVFVLNNAWGAFFSFKINLSSNIHQTIAHIKSAYDSVFPGNPFNYYFLDDEFNRQYQSDLQFGNLFSAFSILAIFIACLGLFALVSFSATLRVKEIGIRKVLGASVGNLMVLLSKEYMILLFIAITLAVPAIIVGGKTWLENYAYKVGIGFDLFLIPGLILLGIAVLTVSYKTFTAARANPVDSLRAE